MLAFDDVAAFERALLGDGKIHAADAPPVRQGHDDGEDAVFALRLIAGEDIGGDVLADRIETVAYRLDFRRAGRLDLLEFFVILLILLLHGDGLLLHALIFFRSVLDLGNELSKLIFKRAELIGERLHLLFVEGNVSPRFHHLVDLGVFLDRLVELLIVEGEAHRHLFEFAGAGVHRFELFRRRLHELLGLNVLPALVALGNFLFDLAEFRIHLLIFE